MRSGARAITPGGAVILWFVLLLICCGLGYPTLRRYDPRDTRRMNFDSANSLYYWQVTGEGGGMTSYPPSLLHFRYRLLVPTVARPFYLLARNHVGGWDPGYFGFLIANSLFSASTAFLLFLLAREVTRDHAAALIAALLYLISFAVPNFHLAGIVDSGEAFAMTALTWALYRGRWLLLPAIGIVGALAKETFLPFSAALAAGWIAVDWIEGRKEGGTIVYRGAMLALLMLGGVATLTAVFSGANGRLVLPWQLAGSGQTTTAGPLGRAVLMTRDLSLLYFFGWLAPLAAASLMRCPRPWIGGAALAAATAVTFGIANNEPGIARSLFDILGPLLSVAGAMTMMRLTGNDEAGLRERRA